MKNQKAKKNRAVGLFDEDLNKYIANSQVSSVMKKWLNEVRTSPISRSAPASVKQCSMHMQPCACMEYRYRREILELYLLSFKTIVILRDLLDEFIRKKDQPLDEAIDVVKISKFFEECMALGLTKKLDEFKCAGIGYDDMEKQLWLE